MHLGCQHGQIKLSFKGHPNGVMCLTSFPSENLASGSVEGKIRIWDTRNGEMKFELTGHTTVLTSFITLPGNSKQFS